MFLIVQNIKIIYCVDFNSQDEDWILHPSPSINLIPNSSQIGLSGIVSLFWSPPFANAIWYSFPNSLKMNLLNPIRAFEFKTLDLERMRMHKILTEKKMLDAFNNQTKNIKD